MEKPPLRIMVLDDDPAFLQAAVDFLNRAGYEVHPFSRPMEGWEMFGRLKPDVLIIDLNMPLLDGREFIPWARRTLPGLVILVCTGLQVSEEDPALKPHIVSAVLQKPVSSAELVRAVENAAFKKRAA